MVQGLRAWVNTAVTMAMWMRQAYIGPMTTANATFQYMLAQ